MARFLVFVVVFGGLMLGMIASKPTKADYLSKLNDRAAAIASLDKDAFSQLRGGDPVDEMVTAQSVVQLIEQTRVADYVIVSVFTTEYHTPGYRARQIRTYGFLSTLISVRD